MGRPRKSVEHSVDYDYRSDYRSKSQKARPKGARAETIRRMQIVDQLRLERARRIDR